jgi:hypothetical protein
MYATIGFMSVVPRAHFSRNNAGFPSHSCENSKPIPYSKAAFFDERQRLRKYSLTNNQESSMSKTDVLVTNLKFPRAIHERLVREAQAHAWTFDTEVLERNRDSFALEHWAEQRDRMLADRQTR